MLPSAEPHGRLLIDIPRALGVRSPRASSVITPVEGRSGLAGEVEASEPLHEISSVVASIEDRRGHGGSGA